MGRVELVVDVVSGEGGGGGEWRVEVEVVVSGEGGGGSEWGGWRW